MRDRLIKLLQDNSYLDVLNEEHWLLAAEQLLENGVVVIDTDVVSMPNRPLITQYMGRPIDEVINLIRKSEWISVDERLPDKFGKYLVYRKSHYASYVDILAYDTNRSVWYFFDSEWGDCEVDNVTHWMPLPEAPKMKGGA